MQQEAHLYVFTLREAPNVNKQCRNLQEISCEGPGLDPPLQASSSLSLLHGCDWSSSGVIYGSQ